MSNSYKDMSLCYAAMCQHMSTCVVMCYVHMCWYVNMCYGVLCTHVLLCQHVLWCVMYTCVVMSTCVMVCYVHMCCYVNMCYDVSYCNNSSHNASTHICASPSMEHNYFSITICLKPLLQLYVFIMSNKIVSYFFSVIILIASSVLFCELSTRPIVCFIHKQRTVSALRATKLL